MAAGRTTPVDDSAQRIKVMTERGKQLLADIRQMPDKTEQNIVIGRLWRMFTEASA